MWTGYGECVRDGVRATAYHDTHDTMANIDLDYGAVVTAIAIESVARAATHEY